MPKNKLAPTNSKFNLTARILHWLMAVLIITMLIIGASMFGFIQQYATLKPIHESLGLIILILAIIRVVNRITTPAPAPPADMTGKEITLAHISEICMYALFIVQPFIGWALVSASGVPTKIAGIFTLPAIMPANTQLYGLLHQIHTFLAFALLVALTIHIIAILFHSIILNDKLLKRMTFGYRHKNHPKHKNHRH